MMIMNYVYYSISNFFFRILVRVRVCVGGGGGRRGGLVFCFAFHWSSDPPPLCHSLLRTLYIAWKQKFIMLEIYT